MRSRGYTGGAVLRRNSGSLSDLSARGRGGAPFQFVDIPEMQVGILSALQKCDRLSLLAAHLMNMCGVPATTRVRYGRLGIARSIIVGTTEYQEQKGRISERRVVEE